MFGEMSGRTQCEVVEGLFGDSPMYINFGVDSGDIFDVTHLKRKGFFANLFKSLSKFSSKKR